MSSAVLSRLQALSRALKDEAHRLGFGLVGITTPEPPLHFDVFKSWLAAGRQGEMDYLASERSLNRRADPRQILPECRSIVCLGIRYPAPPGERAPARASLSGQAAAYALGDDYHDVLPGRLEALVAFLEAQMGAAIPNRWYTDSGPVLERDLAQRAGLGWIGKNTCLINPEQGSYFLLAEILLGLALEPDLPFLADRCGACTRCLEACPTSCILPDRTLDARRCISYLTIELKGAIPFDLRPQIGSWVFGCDVCQQVCPWNQRFASPQGDPAFAPKQLTPVVDLVVESERLTQEVFTRDFRGSPVKRAKRRGYLRNLAVALGNLAVAPGNLASESQEQRASAALGHLLLNDPEPLVRGHAAWALGRLGGKARRRLLGEAAQLERDEAVLGEIQFALDQWVSR